MPVWAVTTTCRLRLCDMFFFCQALGRLGGRQALKLFRFGGFSLDATVSRFMFFAAFGFFDHREKGDDD